jgi:restriction endonuclease S subunit
MTKWRMTKLGEIAEIVRGSTITRKEVTPGEVPVIAGGQTPSCYHNIFNREGTTITVSASGAYAGFVQYFEIPIFASDCSTIKVKDESEISPKFLFYMLQASQRDIYSFQRGSGQPHVYPSQLVGLDVPVPSIDEQHKIVELLEGHLSRLDAALTDVKVAKIKADQFRSSILQSAFKRGVAADHDKSAWATAQLSELVDIGWGDLQVTKKSYVQTGYLAYSATGADGLLPYFDYDSEGIIISAIGANCGKIFRANGKWSCIKNTMRILPKNPSVLLDYLFHYLSDSSIFPKRGSGQPFIGQQDAREIEISFPSIAEQRKIIEFVEYSISRLEASMNLAEAIEIQSVGLRRSLLQAAFTGQLTKEVVHV